MNIDKSLKEVWDWKEKIDQETKNMSMEEKVKIINENALKTSQMYGLNLKVVNKQELIIV